MRASRYGADCGGFIAWHARKCKACRKTFYATEEHAYKDRYGVYCSWSCLRKRNSAQTACFKRSDFSAEERDSFLPAGYIRISRLIRRGEAATKQRVEKCINMAAEQNKALQAEGLSAHERDALCQRRRYWRAEAKITKRAYEFMTSEGLTPIEAVIKAKEEGAEKRGPKTKKNPSD